MVAYRWENPPSIESGIGFQRFWAQRLEQKSDVLLILGLGFDPRMLEALRRLKGAAGSGKRNVHLLDFKRDVPGAHSDLVAANGDAAQQIVAGWGALNSRELTMVTPEGQFVGGRAASRLYSLDDIGEYTDVVVDISSIPRNIYFPLLGSLLTLIHNNESKINLHAVVCENPEIDRQIVAAGGEPQYIHGFDGGFRLMSEISVTRIWAPVLGEGQLERLSSIRELVNPSVICPVFPFPSTNPRRGDELILEYGNLLFTRWQVEPRNIVYASEWNPFDVYRRLKRLHHTYREVLEPLGGAKTAVSSLSSKLLSLGTLLAAYEEKHVGVVHVVSSGHSILNIGAVQAAAATSTLHTVWLTGEPYD